DRLREEDPFTERFAQVVPNRFIARRSRFEVDLNRPRDKAVYLEPSDAWGLTVWARPPDESLLQESLRLYDDFYVEFQRVLNELRTRHGAFVVLDMHSYNHRRDGAEARAGDGAANPDVNVGTSDLDLDRWGPLVDRFMTEVSELSGGLDARTNVRFTGGHLIQWVQQMFPDSNCSLAIEFKKIFMDEWTGELDEPKLDVLVAAFEGSLAGILAELKAVAE
ncbi:MAG TPA: N-formylglutamate amidohydrolase, partial [Actinomycetota bacterium]|nr:N-formylglutamate amidohydrolase [Actinomycetota bacterium]